MLVFEAPSQRRIRQVENIMKKILAPALISVVLACTACGGGGYRYGPGFGGGGGYTGRVEQHPDGTYTIHAPGGVREHVSNREAAQAAREHYERQGVTFDPTSRDR